MTLTWLSEEHPAKLAVSMLKEFAIRLGISSAMKVISMRTHCVYFHCVLIKKSMEESFSSFVDRTEKKISIDC